MTLTTIYFAVALAATTMGSLTGMGGGVIIKPVLDALNHYNAASISALSSATVLVMSLVSVARQIQLKGTFRRDMVLLLGCGSVLGGFLGEQALNFVVASMDNRHVLVVQNSVLASLIVFVFAYMCRKSRPCLHLTGFVPSLLVGVILGVCSAFLGIGGGPINVALIIIFFGLDAKSATICSIATMFFAQASKLSSIALSTGFSLYQMEMLPAMAIGGVLGGLMGASLNKKCSETQVVLCFNLAQILVFSLCIYNIVQNSGALQVL